MLGLYSPNEIDVIWTMVKKRRDRKWKNNGHVKGSRCGRKSRKTKDWKFIIQHGRGVLLWLVLMPFWTVFLWRCKFVICWLSFLRGVDWNLGGVDFDCVSSFTRWICFVVQVVCSLLVRILGWCLVFSQVLFCYFGVFVVSWCFNYSSLSWESRTLFNNYWKNFHSLHLFVKEIQYWTWLSLAYEIDLFLKKCSRLL